MDEEHDVGGQVAAHHGGRLVPRISTRALALAALGVWLGAAAPALPAQAQPFSGAQSTFLDPSIGLAGMGRAGVAVFWDQDPEDWANPALLGNLRGIRYTYGRTQLVPEVADDAYFTTRRIAAGFGGVGISFAGRPLDDIGKAHLDYGRVRGTDPSAQPSAFEDVRTLAVGVNLLEGIQGVVQLLGGEVGRLNRFGDISVGHAWKEIEVDLAPEDGTRDGSAGHGKTSEKDWGALLRVMPLDQMGRPDAVRFRVELGGGFAQRNYDDSQISYVGASGSDPVLEDRRLGASGRLTMAVAVVKPGGIWDFMSPTIALGATWEKSEYYEGGDIAAGDVTRSGQEIVLADVLYLRHGYVDDPEGLIGDDTWGIGVGISYRGVLGARYDWAEVPQSKILDRIDRNGFTMFFDPYRLWQLTRPGVGD